jgi:phosphatidylserine/phosphatidylglycerophosphate/cardiolipin synthase-like enzyme
MLVFFLPLLGAIAYLVLGEKRLGRQFTARTWAIKARYDSWLKDLPPEIRSDLQRLSPQIRSLSRLLEQLKTDGIEVAFALPVSAISVFKVRPDLRLHRKIVVIDDTAAYTGSFNLVDPRLFKQDAGVGEWVDAMVRLEGPGVMALDALFRWDWEVETGRDLNTAVEEGDPSANLRARETDVQVIPSGPGMTGNSIYQLLLMSIYSAQREIVMSKTQ